MRRACVWAAKSMKGGGVGTHKSALGLPDGINARSRTLTVKVQLAIVSYEADQHGTNAASARSHPCVAGSTPHAGAGCLCSLCMGVLDRVKR